MERSGSGFKEEFTFRGVLFPSSSNLELKKELVLISSNGKTYNLDYCSKGLNIMSLLFREILVFGRPSYADGGFCIAVRSAKEVNK